jgi:hypothetical protein
MYVSYGNKLKALYPTQGAFLAKYDGALKRSVEEGVVLAEDVPKLREAALAWSARSQ